MQLLAVPVVGVFECPYIWSRELFSIISTKIQAALVSSDLRLNFTAPSRIILFQGSTDCLVISSSLSMSILNIARYFLRLYKVSYPVNKANIEDASIIRDMFITVSYAFV